MKVNRLHQIQDYFISHHFATTQELSKTFNVSIETVRRDLALLEAEGFIKRSYGGAHITIDNNMPQSLDPWSIRMAEHHTEKVAIAHAMIERIPDGATIALDAGTTIFEVTKLLSRRHNLTIITNCIHQAIEISQNTEHILYFVGGAMKRDELITTGFLAHDFLNSFSKVDMAIICSDAFTLSQGAMEFSLEMAKIKQQMIRMADKVVYLGDYMTFEGQALYHCCSLNDIDTIICDDQLNEEIIHGIRNSGVELILAPMV